MADAPDGCQFIAGREGPRAIFCGQPAQRASSYCVEHHARVYVKPADRVPTEPQVTPTKGAAADYARRLAEGRSHRWNEGEDS
jgi:hypothetical protein